MCIAWAQPWHKCALVPRTLFGPLAHAVTAESLCRGRTTLRAPWRGTQCCSGLWPVCRWRMTPRVPWRGTQWPVTRTEHSEARQASPSSRHPRSAPPLPPRPLRVPLLSCRQPMAAEAPMLGRASHSLLPCPLSLLRPGLAFSAGNPVLVVLPAVPSCAVPPCLVHPCPISSCPALVFRWPCHLQVNVFLRVTQKRVDGYHDLASLFHVR